MTHINYYRQHYKQLIGYKVTDIVVEDDDVFGSDVPFVAFVMKRRGKTTLLVTLFSDEEGNGTGHLDIQAYEENEN